MRTLLRKPSLTERGATLIDYAIVVAIVSILAMAGVSSLGNSSRKVVLCAGANLQGFVCNNAGGIGEGG